MYGWAGRLKDFCWAEDRAYVFVALNKQGGAELGKFAWDGLGWQQVTAITAPETMAFRTGEGSALSLTEAAGWTALEIARKGWQAVPLIYVVPEQELIRYGLNLPPELSAEEQRVAAYWELDDKLMAKGLSGEDFSCLCHSVEGKCVITAVRKGYLQEVQEAFAQAELTLADTIPAEGQGLEQSVLAYLNSSQRAGAGFGNRPGKGLAWRRLSAAWLAFMLFVCICFTAVDVYHYQQSRSQVAEQQEELARLGTERQQVMALQDKQACIEKREGLWLKLGQQEATGYSLLVHLGTGITEGVCLTHINAGENGQGILVEGQAVSYDCLSEFMARLEEDRAFFPRGAVLERSATCRQGQDGADKVEFSLRINGEREVDGKNPKQMEKF